MNNLSNERLREKLRAANALLSHEHADVRIHAQGNIAVLTELLAYREAAENPVGFINGAREPVLYGEYIGLPIATHFYAAPPLPVVPDERAEFESFMSERFGDLIDIRRAKNGDQGYMAWGVVVAWIVWQRRAMIKPTSFREIDNSSTKQFRENAETSTKCPKCSGRGTYHCPQANGTVECECTLAAAPKPGGDNG